MCLKNKSNPINLELIRSGDCCRSHFLLHTTVSFNSTLDAQTITNTKHLPEEHLWKYIKIFVHLQLRPCEQNSYNALSLFQLHKRALHKKTKNAVHFIPHLLPTVPGINMVAGSRGQQTSRGHRPRWPSRINESCSDQPSAFRLP